MCNYSDTASKRFAVLILSGLVAGVTTPAGAVVVSLLNTEQHGHETAYRYKVTNDSARPLESILLGRDGCHDEEPELTATPSGWQVGQPIPDRSAKAPKGWRATVISQEDTDHVYIVWEAADPKFGLPPGHTSSEFEVVTSSPDAGYRTGHWTATDNDSVISSAPLGKPGKRAEWNNGETFCRP